MVVERAFGEDLRNGLSVKDFALVTANGAKYANTWLVTIPADRKPWLLLADPYYRLSMRLRLGLSTLDAPDVPCLCGHVDSLRDEPWHPLSCGQFAGLWKSRHDGVKQILARLASSCG